MKFTLHFKFIIQSLIQVGKETLKMFFSPQTKNQVNFVDSFFDFPPIFLLI